MSEEKKVYIKKGYERVVRTPEELLQTNDLTMGQVFHAVADYYEKDQSDYSRWISFSENKNEFDIIKARIEECEFDLDKIHMVCDWLGEDLIS